ncbi:SAM-dependent methyltransferase [Mitsuaria sp. WAJ17]|uniref:CheR family methyltransferase n=1 Tax=Mitsuaria sp. WAJ17 TaxID=2761452 RepID=UPI001603A45D|nr:CheR family methyltransferase [Mitsuaria sp. WAJ17]MBB2485357.1 SAM-dependent methyltransferase [Mitsuaria sp. WAJ17]
MQEISTQEFTRFQDFIFREAGITLGDNKRALVSGRLDKRLRHFKLASFSDYLRLLESGREPLERQHAIDLLTTNETYFFREPTHFQLLRECAQQSRQQGRPLRVWSAACSSGEEPYSIAMVLDDELGAGQWEVLGTDICTRMLGRARRGHYPESRASHLPDALRRRYCLKGLGPQAGTLLVERGLRQQVQFEQVNLTRPLPALGRFDLIFLRNVMIYFNVETKRQVVARLIGQLRPGGLLLVGHSETLNDISDAVQAVRPSVYRKP